MRTHFSATAKRGRGTTGAREASEPWWRGRRSRSFVIVAERAQRRRCFTYDSNVTGKLNVNARRERLCGVEACAPSTTPSGWSPSPAIAVADEVVRRGFAAPNLQTHFLHRIELHPLPLR